jgi:hypothetical protein
MSEGHLILYRTFSTHPAQRTPKCVSRIMYIYLYVQYSAHHLLCVTNKTLDKRDFTFTVPCIVLTYVCY